jgi:hypothetical protein
VTITPSQREYTAFGERKSLKEWARDSRCPHTLPGLIYRVIKRGMSIREAFAPRHDPRVKYWRRAFGELKPLAEWSRDPRCPIPQRLLYSRVLKRGLTVEEAFARGPFDMEAVKPKRQRPVTAFGETKTAGEWEADPRARASAGLIVSRIRRGYAQEDAISKTATELTVLKTAGKAGKHFHEAFGERKTLGAWFRDSRCQVSRWGLYFRVLKMGMTVEQALDLGPHDPSRPRDPNRRGKRPGRKSRWTTVTAWGKTKTPEEWASDRRASVSARVIVGRLRSGWTPEQAIAKARYEHRRPGVQRTVKKKRRRRSV